MIIEKTKKILLSEVGIDVKQIPETGGFACGNETLYPLINTDIIKNVLEDDIVSFVFEKIKYNVKLMDKINIDTDFNLDAYFSYDFSYLKPIAQDETCIKIFVEYNNDSVKKLIQNTADIEDLEMMCLEVTLEEADKDYLLRIVAELLDECFSGQIIL